MGDMNHLGTQEVLDTFSPEQRSAILARDERRCVMCGYDERHGVQLYVDYIRPLSLGGQAIIDNGQTLCSQHYAIKKQSNQTDSGRQMFMRLHETAQREGNQELMDFCADVLNVYAEHGINSHIEWKSN